MLRRYCFTWSKLQSMSTILIPAACHIVGTHRLSDVSHVGSVLIWFQFSTSSQCITMQSILHTATSRYRWCSLPFCARVSMAVGHWDWSSTILSIMWLLTPLSRDKLNMCCAFGRGARVSCRARSTVPSQNLCCLTVALLRNATLSGATSIWCANKSCS